MEFRSGGKRHSLNEDVLKAMTYEQLEEKYKGLLDWETLARMLGTKPTPKKRIVKSEEK